MAQSDIISPRNANEEVLRYHTGTIDSAFGGSGGGTLEYAIRFTPTELVQWSGWSIQAVDFYHWEPDENFGEIKIYDEGTSTTPGTLISSEPYTLNEVGWKRINLTNPVLLNTSRDIWVSTEITFQPGYPMGLDDTFHVAGKSAWYKPPGGLFTDVGNYYSWSLEAVIVQTFQWDHDISILNINTPESGTGHIVTPEITIRNRGLTDEYAVPINLKVSYWNTSLNNWVIEYNQTLDIDINSNQTNDVVFPDWTPLVLGTENVDVDYLVQASVQITNDMDPNNDYLSKEVSLHFDYLHNLGVNEIVSPNSGRPAVISPELIMENYGQNDETDVNVSFTIQRLSNITTILLEEDFENGIPSTWTVTDGYNDGATWRDDNPWGRIPPPGSNCDGTFVICDELYEETPMNEYLASPVFSCVGETTILFDFGSYFRSIPQYDQYGEVDAFNGTTWTTVYYVTDTSAFAQKYIDLSPLLAGVPIAQIRFHFFSNDWAYFWMVDNIKIYGATFVTEYQESHYLDIESAEIISVTFSDWTPWTPPTFSTKVEYKITGGTQLDQGVLDGDPIDNNLVKWITVEHIHDVGVERITKPSRSPIEWLYYHYGYANNGVGLTSGGTYEAAMRLTPEELGEYNNRKIDIVKFYHHEAGTHVGNIKIYTEGTSESPGPLITSEPYTVTGKGWYEVILSSPVTINAEEDLWVSVEITHSAGQYPIGIDSGPAVLGKGDWIYINGGWEEISGAGLNSNWCIEAHLKDHIEWLPGTYPVEAIVANYGTYNEITFNVNASIYKETERGDELFYHNDSIFTQTLEPGDNATVQFADVTFTDSDEGTYWLEITSELPSDDNTGNNQEEMEFIISVPDTMPPETSHEFSGTIGDNNWYISDVTLLLTATDPTPPYKRFNSGKGPSGVNHTYYKIDAGAWLEYTTPVVVSVDGQHQVSYYSIDMVGNTEPTQGPFSFKMDKTSPQFTGYTFTPLNLLKNKWLCVADVTDATSGVVRVEFYVDDALVGSVTTAPYEFEFDGNPTNNSKALAYDAAGNSALSPIAQYIEYDYQAQSYPTIQLLQEVNLRTTTQRSE
ncbi:MAG TPA: Ig-like domain-containing protein [Candidatus Thermoplasmatota archaeon]|nr:Ig-like domain-containing protein [Candidatus Thermoplasmatota archaeon]